MNAQSSGLKIQLKGIGGSPPTVISFGITVERQSFNECSDISKLFDVIAMSVALLGARPTGSRCFDSYPHVTLRCEKVRLGGFWHTLGERLWILRVDFSLFDQK